MLPSKAEHSCEQKKKKWTFKSHAREWVKLLKNENEVSLKN